MLQKGLSISEIKEWVYSQMSEWTGAGFSPMDASTIVSHLSGANANKILDIYLDGKVAS